MADKESDFRVVDKRASTGAKDDPVKANTGTSSGDGFTMKEAPGAKAGSQVDFSTLLLSLATGSLIHMGLAPDPATNKIHKNVELAKHNIEILTLLKEKTKGNLTPDEARLFENLLTEIRLRFVETAKG